MAEIGRPAQANNFSRISMAPKRAKSASQGENVGEQPRTLPIFTFRC